MGLHWTTSTGTNPTFLPRFSTHIAHSIMAPLRRYLRITKHSVLEVRIYLDRPADAETWLVRRDNPALPRVIQAVWPLVLPKLREENERARGRSGSKSGKRGVKDVVIEGKPAPYKSKWSLQSS